MWTFKQEKDKQVWTMKDSCYNEITLKPENSKFLLIRTINNIKVYEKKFSDEQSALQFITKLKYHLLQKY